jgi:peptidoglycan/LPS O-acetylase OafA/YrhL
METHIGISIFFVLSGFLIANKYYDDAKRDAVWIKTYLIKRVARIYPIYSLLTIFSYLLAVKFTPLDLILDLSFVRGYTEPLFPILLQGWYLTVEASFYLNAPIIC